MKQKLSLARNVIFNVAGTFLLLSLGWYMALLFYQMKKILNKTIKIKSRKKSYLAFVGKKEFGICCAIKQNTKTDFYGVLF